MTEIKTPKWMLIRNLPKHLNKGAIESAVSAFIKDIKKHGQGIDNVGLFNSTMQGIAQACVLRHDGSGGDFWAAIGEDGWVYAYSLAKIVIDVDNRVTYWVTQGWIHPLYRHQYLLEGWKALEAHARKNLCKHMINVTDRHPGAYLKLLGKEWHTYATLLKKDLED